MNPLEIAYFYVCATFALGGAIAVVLAKNPIRGAMGLLLLILSVAGLFLALHAQFLAAIQLIVYAGAIVVLFLFVIMLLGPNAATPHDRRGLFARCAGGGLFALSGLAGLAAVVKASPAHHAMTMPPVDSSFGGIDAFGSVLFSDAIVPFEVSSALLMVAVLGAVGVARGRQGVKTLTRNELEAGGGSPAPALPADHSGVYSHELGGDHAPEGAAKETA